MSEIIFFLTPYYGSIGPVYFQLGWDIEFRTLRLRNPPLCATLFFADGVGELYQRRSTLLWSRWNVQTTTPSGLGMSENGL